MVRPRGAAQTLLCCLLLFPLIWGAAYAAIFGLSAMAAVFAPASTGYAVEWIASAGFAATLMALVSLQPPVPNDAEPGDTASDPAALARSIAASSHELRTPLAAIIGLTTLLADTPLDADQARHVEALRSSARDMLAHVTDILDLSRLDAGELSLEADVIDLDALLGRLHIVETVATRGLLVRVVATRDPAVPRYVAGDRPRLTQILLTILGHAAGSGAASVLHIRAVCGAGRRLRFAFSAEEPGRTAKDLAGLFQPFGEPQHAGSPEGGGALFGVALGEKLAALMGGEIRTGRPESGPHLVLDLPLVAAAAPPAAAIQLRGPLALTILLADDATSNLHVMSLLLRRLGHHVVAVSNGLEAIEAARDTAFDLCLLDLRMHGIGGIEAARAIRALNAPHGMASIYALSGRIDSADRRACRVAGMDGCLVKPLCGAELDALLDSVAGRPRSGLLMSHG